MTKYYLITNEDKDNRVNLGVKYTDYLELAKFTGQFNNESELKEYLLNNGYIKEDVYALDIVKQKGTKKEDITYSKLSDPVIYKSTLSYMRPNYLIQLFKSYDNKNTFSFFKAFYDSYKIELEERINGKINYNKSCYDEAKRNQNEYSINITKEQLNRLNRIYAHIVEYLNCMDSYRKNELRGDINLDIDNFIKGETTSNNRPNKRGLAKLARFTKITIDKINTFEYIDDDYDNDEEMLDKWDMDNNGRTY